MKENALIYLGVGLAGGYLLAHAMKSTTAAVGAYSLPCECSGGGQCNSGRSDCSCCPGQYGRITPINQVIPIQQRRTVGL
jgi:hypothetical protein